MNRRLAWIASLAVALRMSGGFATEVGYAGFAYAGGYQSIVSQFPFTSRIAAPRASGAPDAAGPGEIERRLLEQIGALHPKNIELNVDSLSTLEGHDQAVIVALVLTGETVSTERLAVGTKLFIYLRAQALFFDFKTMTVLRAYPIRVASISQAAREFTDAEKLQKVHDMIVGDGQRGLLSLFNERLENASLPNAGARSVGVTQVSVSPEAAAELPQTLRGAGVAETWLADSLSSAFLEATGVTFLPFAKGYAIGNTMATHMADGTVFNLKIPTPDYSVSVDLQTLKKMLYASGPSGSSFIYGSLIHLKMEEPLLQQRYFDATLKNGEAKSVPASQTVVDDGAAFVDSVNGLLQKFAATVAGNDGKWIKAASTLPDVMQRITSTRAVLRSCK